MGPCVNKVCNSPDNVLLHSIYLQNQKSKLGIISYLALHSSGKARFKNMDTAGKSQKKHETCTPWTFPYVELVVAAAFNQY